ncbi:hypothetical protein FA95DRAFT_1503928, partial [Auriscalpium vulgare]
MERFQAVYGWLTSWPKSLLLALGLPDPPASVDVPSVDPTNPRASTVVPQSVRVVHDHMEFLRVPTNDPHRQFQHLRDLIMNFQFPVLARPLPFTLLRRLVTQRLISSVRPRLSFQPLLPKDADALDQLLASRIHEYLRFPFRFHSKLLSLPLSFYGLDFPSIARLNDSAAVVGLQRDLNHHSLIFRTIATITLTDWTCQLGHCCPPLVRTSPAYDRSYVRSTSSLPFAWIHAHSTLRALRTSVHHTDQSYLLTGSLSLQHVARMLPSSPSAHTIQTLARAGITELADVGHWETDSFRFV